MAHEYKRDRSNNRSQGKKKSKPATNRKPGMKPMSGTSHKY